MYTAPSLKSISRNFLHLLQVQSNVAVGTPDYISPEILRVSLDIAVCICIPCSMSKMLSYLAFFSLAVCSSACLHCSKTQTAQPETCIGLLLHVSEVAANFLRRFLPNTFARLAAILFFTVCLLLLLFRPLSLINYYFSVLEIMQYPLCLTNAALTLAMH